MSLFINKQMAQITTIILYVNIQPHRFDSTRKLYSHDPPRHYTTLKTTNYRLSLVAFSRQPGKTIHYLCIRIQEINNMTNKILIKFRSYFKDTKKF